MDQYYSFEGNCINLDDHFAQMACRPETTKEKQNIEARSAEKSAKNSVIKERLAAS